MMNAQINGQEGMVAALDVGSSKVACLIAQAGSGGQMLVKGVGNRAAGGGVMAGAVIDMQLTEQAIRASVDQAEKMAGTTISDVVLSFSGGSPKSTVIEVEVDISAQGVGEAELTEAYRLARAQIDAEDDALLHMIPAAYGVDGNFSSKAPIGMYGKSLSVALLAVTIDVGPLRNLETCVRRAHLNVGSVVLAPYASGLACLVDDEAKMGAACIDLGGGTTGISIFAQGALVHAEVLPFGGMHVTAEVARGLLTPFEQAERLKTFNGAAVVDPADARVEIEIQQVGESGSDRMVRMPRSKLTGVMQREMEQLFTTIGEKLDASGFSGVAGKRVVLTGGVAQCEAVRDLASKILGRQVRIGRPKALGGLPVAAQAPNFSGAVGLLTYAAKEPQQTFGLNRKQEAVLTGSLFGRISQWVKETF